VDATARVADAVAPENREFAAAVEADGRVVEVLVGVTQKSDIVSR
jgi:hypothetical protein